MLLGCGHRLANIGVRVMMLANGYPWGKDVPRPTPFPTRSVHSSSAGESGTPKPPARRVGGIGNGTATRSKLDEAPRSRRAERGRLMVCPLS
jgi:hypothetical protein